MPAPIHLYRTSAPFAGAQQKCIIYLMESTSVVLDLIAHQTALDNAPTIWVLYPQNRGVIQVPSTIVFEPSQVPLPPTNGTQTYQVDDLLWGVEFINHFRQADEATVSGLGDIAWDREGTEIRVELTNYLVTDGSGQVWVMDDTNYEMWLNG